MVPLSLRAIKGREQPFRGFQMVQGTPREIRGRSFLPRALCPSDPWIDAAVPAAAHQRRGRGEYRGNCGSVAEEDYTLPRRRLARSDPPRERVIAADIYTFVTLPARLRDSSEGFIGGRENRGPLYR